MFQLHNRRLYTTFVLKLLTDFNSFFYYFQYLFECPNITHASNYFHKRYAVYLIVLAFIASGHLCFFGSQVRIGHTHNFLVLQFTKKGYSLEWDCKKNRLWCDKVSTYIKHHRRLAMVKSLLDFTSYGEVSI